MKLIAFGTLVFATVLACGNATSSEPAATPNAATQTQTNTTGASVQQQQGTTKTGDYNQATTGKGMPGAGDSRAVAAPVAKPAPTFATPQAPAPTTTGDPPPTEHR